MAAVLSGVLLQAKIINWQVCMHYVRKRKEEPGTCECVRVWACQYVYEYACTSYHRSNQAIGSV